MRHHPSLRCLPLLLVVLGASCATRALSADDNRVPIVDTTKLGPCTAETLVALFQELDDASWSVIVCGDVDGDGIHDLALRSSSRAVHGERSIWIVSSKTLKPQMRVIARGLDGCAPLIALSPVADKNGDGVSDFMMERQYVSDPTESGPSSPSVCISGSDGARIERDWDAEYLRIPRSDCVYAREPNTDTWDGSAPDGKDPVTLPSASSEACSAAQRAHPEAHVLQVVGDLDGDGAVDLLAVADSPGRALLISGADGHVLREMPIAKHAIGVARAYAQPLGDLDGDGVVDVLVFGRVTESASDLAPHELELGVAAILSGANGRPLRTLDPSQFEERSKLDCRVVRLTD